MVKVDLKGIAQGDGEGADLLLRLAGGPAFGANPGHRNFMLPTTKQLRSRRTPDGPVPLLCRALQGEPRLWELADSPSELGAWLDRIADYFGELRIAQFDRPEKIRPMIRRWRNQWADKPRTADYGLQVLSRVLSYAVDPLGKIAGNPCEGIKQLYSGDRSEIIWTDCGHRPTQETCSAEIAHAVDLAAHTGLRLGDLCACPGPTSATTRSSSRPARATSGARRSSPCMTGCGSPRRGSPTIDRDPHQQRGGRGRDGFGSGVRQGKTLRHGRPRPALSRPAGNRRDPVLHRRPERRVIAEIMGWEEEHVARIIRRYVGRSAATKALIHQLNQTEKRT